MVILYFEISPSCSDTDEELYIYVKLT